MNTFIINIFKKQIGVLQKKYFPDKVIFQKLSKKKQTALKKKEIIRLANIDKKITDIRSQIVEFVLLDLIGNFFKNYSVKKNQTILTEKHIIIIILWVRLLNLVFVILIKIYLHLYLLYWRILSKI